MVGCPRSAGLASSIRHPLLALSRAYRSPLTVRDIPSSPLLLADPCPFPPPSMSPSSAPAPPASARRGRWSIPASRCIVLEARDRVGGRGHTIMARRGYHLRRRLRLAAFGRQEFVRRNRRTAEFRDRQDAAALARAGSTAAFPPKRSATISSARSTPSTTAPRTAPGAKSGRDSAAERCLEPGNRWNPMIDAISTYVNGCELDQVSILDMDAYEDTDINWRVRRGYGALMAAYGAPCPLALNTQVDADRSFRQAPADRDLAGHADRRQGDRHRADQSDRRRGDSLSSPRCRQKSTPRAACRSGSPTR